MIGLALAGGAIAVSPAQARDWKTVANSATTIPGTLAPFSSFNQPSINDQCTLIFRGRGKGPGTPVRGVYFGSPCSPTFNPSTSLRKLAATGDAVPDPNNLSAPFTEFPSIPRIDRTSNFAATRAQHRPVWRYLLPDDTETRVGTAGVYTSLLPLAVDSTATLTTAASQLGAVPGFSYFDVPGFPGVKFDQFPGAPTPFRRNWVAFKGNFNDGTTTRTGVYYRHVVPNAQVRKIADTTNRIPGTAVNFGSTAPPSGDGSTIVFYGSDNEDAPTAGGIFRYDITTRGPLETLVSIGDPIGNRTFTKFGEGLSYNGGNLGFWGAWGAATRTVRLHCPADGQADIIAECIKQCPDTDTIGNYCEREVPAHQGIFVRRSDGTLRRIALARPGGEFQDFLFWVFSGAPPLPDSDAEPPRWRSSAFVAISPAGRDNIATVFKASKANGETGLYIRKRLATANEPLILEGSLGRAIDRSVPDGARVTSVGVERDGFRNCTVAVTAGFLNATTSESWAGVYINQNACLR